MTQPIQEPSTPRSISGLTWGQSQLARRPSPTGGGCVAAGIGLVATQSIVDFPTGTPGPPAGWQVVEFDTAMFNEDATVFNVAPADFRIEIFQPGIYTASLAVGWGGDWTGFRGAGVVWLGSTWTDLGFVNRHEFYASGALGPDHLEPIWMAASGIAYLESVDGGDAGHLFPAVDALVAQESGSDQDLAAATLVVVRLGR